MKNLYSYKEFLNEKNNVLNEGLFKNIFKSIGRLAKSIKGSNAITSIIDKSKKDIEPIFKKWEESLKQSKAAKNESKIYEQLEDSTVDTDDTATTNTDVQSLKDLNKLYIEKINTIIKRTKRDVKKTLTNLQKNNPSNKLSSFADLQMDVFEDEMFAKKEKLFLSTGNKEAVSKIQNERKKLEQNIKEKQKKLKNTLSAKEQESDQAITPKKGNKYMYDSESLNKKIEIEIVSDKSDDKGYWKVKNIENDKEFNVDPKRLSNKESQNKESQ